MLNLVLIGAGNLGFNFYREFSRSKKINLSALNSFFKFGYVTGEQTILEGIYKVMPGQTLTFKNNIQ